ncbi:glucoamylase family protein [Emticicia sp. CRIBPO]|uniref:glucoamylase family protein n=1 Tax=Emticicia sp. CRIBPO TaxID=2683258 RepID=UPI001E3542B6|nr:glucoamylase family protein [Emticicia sp. CRIBPO]
MLKKKINLLNLLFLGMVWLVSCKKTEQAEPLPEPVESFYYKQISVNGENNQLTYTNINQKPQIKVSFSAPLQAQQISNFISLSSPNENIPLTITLANHDSSLVISPAAPLPYLSKYTFSILPALKSAKGTPLNTTVLVSLFTAIDSTDKFARIPDEELLTLVQKQTFAYFWDFAHPESGMARERNTSGDIVTSGGTGFGIMSILVAIERGFITREQGKARIEKITEFLRNKADKYHGAFPHWLNGGTGKTIPFSQKDDGADLVETSFLMEGLLTARQYFNQPEDASLKTGITALWEAVEWDWFTKNKENVLYWHWSPNYGWDMNHAIRGWNECLITYVLAASSPTHPISYEVYNQGFARNGSMKNGNSYYNYKLPLGGAYGGPLFFEHYSFLGLDPRGLSDAYADFGEQVVNHSKINYQYCVTNPKSYNGYSKDCWGLTASDSNNGYAAHEPNNDLGVISPTAALSSMPYTPEESMRALRFFYYKMGDKLWGRYGFKDAFNLTSIWFAESFLAIDQGPVIVMIENHRSQLLWKHFMAVPEVKTGLKNLNFKSAY